MKRFSLGFLSLVVMAVLTMVSCSKGKDGATGPAGPAGPTGATGTSGSSGTIYSAWLNTTFNQYTIDSYGDTEVVAVVTAPKLVDSIVQKGSVMVYMNFGSADQPSIVALPYIDAFNNVFVNMQMEDQEIDLISNYDLSTYTGTDGEVYLQVRYVLIPGGIAGRSLINWKDYNQVKKYLGLKD